jgi:hypothetical protein
MTTFYELLEEQLILHQKAKGNWAPLPTWFVNDYLESLAKDLIRRFDEENSKSS